MKPCSLAFRKFRVWILEPCPCAFTSRSVSWAIAAGSATVGKSTLIKRYCESRFVQKYIPTIGIDYGVKPVRVLGHDLKVNFFDTSGAEFDTPAVNPQYPPFTSGCFPTP